MVVIGLNGSKMTAYQHQRRHNSHSKLIRAICAICATKNDSVRVNKPTKQTTVCFGKIIMVLKVVSG